MTLGEWSPPIPCDVLDDPGEPELFRGDWSAPIPCPLFDPALVNPAVMLTGGILVALVPQDD